MKRVYKLAANFNTVEFEVTDADLNQYVNLDNPNECEYDEDGGFYAIAEEKILARLLQKEYDIIAGIDVVKPAPVPEKAKASAPDNRYRPTQLASQRQLDIMDQYGISYRRGITAQEASDLIKHSIESSRR